MLQGGGNFDLAHEPFQRFVGDRNFRQKSLNCHCLPVSVIARQHHTAHTAPAEHPNHLVAGHRLRALLQFLATFFANKRQVFFGGCLGLIATAAIRTFDGHNHGTGECGRFRDVRFNWIGSDQHFQDRLAALDAVAIAQENL